MSDTKIESETENHDKDNMITVDVPVIKSPNFSSHIATGAVFSGPNRGYVTINFFNEVPEMNELERKLRVEGDFTYPESESIKDAEGRGPGAHSIVREHLSRIILPQPMFEELVLRGANLIQEKAIKKPNKEV